MSGAVSYHAGLAAEKLVAAEYARRGMTVLHHRWRGRAGEIDLVVRDGGGFIFVEVKKSRNFARAAARVTRRQMDRIYATASEYLATTRWGQNSEARFDVAMVNACGEISLLENAFREAA